MHIFETKNAMKAISKAIVVISAALSASCAVKVENGYDGGFDHVTKPLYGTVQIKSEMIKEPEKVLIPLRLFISKDVLVLLNDNGESFYNIYTLPNLRFINTLGKRQNLEGLHVSPYAESVRVGDQGFEIFDNGSLKEILIHFDELEISETKRIAGPTKDLIGFTPLNDSLYAIVPEPELFKNGTHSPFDDSEVLIVDNNSGDITRVGEFPPSMRENGLEAGVKVFAVNEKSQRLAVFYHLQKQMKIVGFDGKVIRSVAVDIAPYLNYETMSFSNEWGDYVYYTDCYAADNYIYALCLNESRNRYMWDMGKKNSEIHIFDWDGNLLQIIRCDYPLTCFTVSEKYGYIYASSIIYPDYIFRFPIPEIASVNGTKSVQGE